MKREIFVTTDFEAIHWWPDAPDSEAFLRHPHCHIFKVKVWAEVQHNDRDIEFINFKHWLDCYIAERARFNQDNVGSCESMAEFLLYPRNEITKVSVSEDGENGAVITK